MPMKPAIAAQKTTAIHDAFAAIGAAGETAMPRSKGNREPVAWEYYVACELSSYAETRKKKAIKAAQLADVVFDPEKQPLVPGTSAIVYSGDVVEIKVEVGNPQTRLDMKPFVESLEKAGLDRKKIDALVAKHTIPNRAPHKFRAELATSR